MKLWDQLLSQAEESLNMLDITHDDPTKSADEILHGKQNFNAHPWVPPGCKAIVCEKPKICTSWGPRQTDVQCTGPAKDHY